MDSTDESGRTSLFSLETVSINTSTMTSTTTTTTTMSSTWGSLLFACVCVHSEQVGTFLVTLQQQRILVLVVRRERGRFHLDLITQSQYNRIWSRGLLPQGEPGRQLERHFYTSRSMNGYLSSYGREVSLQILPIVPDFSAVNNAPSK